MTYMNSAGEVMGNYMQALAAILIPVSPNLENLAMPQPFFSHTVVHAPGGSPGTEYLPYDYPLDRLLQRANADPSNVFYLQNLRRVYFIVDETCFFERGKNYLPIDFFHCTKLVNNLPSIESVGTDALCEEDYSGSRLEPGSSNISRLHLNHCALRMPYLAYLTLSCKELREFQYRIGGRRVAATVTVPFNPKGFIKAICPHKATLEILDIDAEHNMYYFDNYDIDDNYRWKIDDRAPNFEYDDYYHSDPELQSFAKSLWEYGGSLKEVRSLRRLSVGIEFLLYFAQGVPKERLSDRYWENEATRDEYEDSMLPNELPESLEYLCVRGYEQGENAMHDAQIDALMAHCESGSTQIKEIVGIDECIPHSEDLFIQKPEEAYLWSLGKHGHNPF